MKNERVLLAEWLGDITDGYVDIPWPRVHELAGSETVRWLRQQPSDRVQMILERQTDSAAGLQRLYAEFYVPSLRTEFVLRFAK